jgi:hypothetical protein
MRKMIQKIDINIRAEGAAVPFLFLLFVPFDFCPIRICKHDSFLILKEVMRFD